MREYGEDPVFKGYSITDDFCGTAPFDLCLYTSRGGTLERLALRRHESRRDVRSISIDATGPDPAHGKN